ncbi:MAG: D-glycerate dehydrogenase [Planctomycetaceae bacterium]|nr:D-glycerate dehydrogenase [Planctomycetaceae bacterium]
MTMRIVVLLDCVGDARPRFETSLARAGFEPDEVTIDIIPDGATRPKTDLHRLVSGASAVVTPLTLPVDQAFLDAAGPQLRVVANYAVGFDNIDRIACAEREVVVCNGPPPMTEPTADLAWALVLAAIRRLREGLDLARSGTWKGHEPRMLLGHRLVGRNLLVVGAGRIGSAVARRSIGWEMKVSYTARGPKPGIEAPPISAVRTTLEDGLPEADVIVVTTSLTDETRHLIDARAFELMKPTAVLVNVSRGPVVDETALTAALAEGRIFAAGLDVYEHEPRISRELRDLPNAMLLPHVASATVEDRTDLTDICVENVVAMLSGVVPPHSVDPPRDR